MFFIFGYVLQCDGVGSAVSSAMCGVWKGGYTGVHSLVEELEGAESL